MRPLQRSEWRGIRSSYRPPFSYSKPDLFFKTPKFQEKCCRFSTLVRKREQQCHGRPAGSGLRDKLVPAVREAFESMRLHGHCPRRCEPGAVGKLVSQKPLDALLVCGVLNGH